MSDSSSSLKSLYLADLDLLETPLVGLLGKPAEDFTEEELREFVRQQRTLRESRQSWKAAIALGKKGGVKEEQSKSNRLFDEF